MNRRVSAFVLVLALQASVAHVFGAAMAQQAPAPAAEPAKPADSAEPSTTKDAPAVTPSGDGTAKPEDAAKPAAGVSPPVGAAPPADAVVPADELPRAGMSLPADAGTRPADTPKSDRLLSPLDIQPGAADGKPPEATPSGPPPDLAYGAFQRGFYLQALDEATKRVVAAQDPAAMTLIGQLYAGGLGVPLDKRKAAQWYSEAAERGDRHAIFAYGMIKLLGDGVPKDEAGGMLLLNRAAEMMVPEASYNLGIIALKPSNGPPDYATAYKRFSEAAIANNGDALYSLGILTKDGKGVQADPKKAADYFLAAANAGNLDGMVEYGLALFNGNGVQQDQELAGDWFERAAQRGSPIARNRLARMYAAGVGIAPNPILACMWNILAKAAGLDDKQLDDFMARQTPEVQAAAMEGARYHGL